MEGINPVMLVPNPDLAKRLDELIFGKKEETTDKTVMEEWAEESEKFSKAVNSLLESFGFSSDYEVKYELKEFFTENFIKTYNALYRKNIDWWDKKHLEKIDSLKLAKAILFASTFLQTTNLEEVINWANN